MTTRNETSPPSPPQFNASAAELFARASAFFGELHNDICRQLTQADGGAEFRTESWDRPGGGGGVSRVLEGGRVFEKAGVNWSNVEGDLPEHVAKDMPGTGTAFRASGVSLVIHPRSPMIPTTHANFRMFLHGERAWFGGGADLTPYYLDRSDATHFHRTLAGACDAHRPIGDYDAFKAWCDRYFYLPHRAETRGVGGIFFDWLGATDGHDLTSVFDFVRTAGAAFCPAYLPIVDKHRDDGFGDEQRRWQLQRRGRYVEFNLVYDRGTLFGLKTAGRIESILMSLPPEVRWDYDVQPRTGSPESELLAALKPTDWLTRS